MGRWVLGISSPSLTSILSHIYSTLSNMSMLSLGKVHFISTYPVSICAMNKLWNSSRHCWKGDRIPTLYLFDVLFQNYIWSEQRYFILQLQQVIKRETRTNYYSPGSLLWGSKTEPEKWSMVSGLKS